MRRSIPRALPGLAAAVLTLGLAVPACAFDMNGFLPARGEGNLALSYTEEGYDHFWVGETKVSVPDVGEVDITSVSAWFNYGLTDHIALIGSLPYVRADSDGPAGIPQEDLQDLSWLLEARLASLGGGAQSLVGAAGVRTPAADYEDDLPVDIGDGTTDVLFRLIYQVQAGGFYFSQQVGYNLRGGDAPNDWPFYTELGYTVGRVTLTGFLSWLQANDGTDIGEGPFPSNREEYQRAGAKIYARLSDRLGISVAGFDTLDGRNTGETSGFSAGLNLRF